MSNLAIRLEQYRIEMQVKTKQAFAELLGVSPQAYSGYTNPDPTAGRAPDFGDLLRIADTMCVSIDWLTGRADYPKWSRLVRQLQEHLMIEAAKIPPPPATDVMDRTVAVIGLCRAFAPTHLDRDWFMAGVLGLAIPDYHNLVNHKVGRLEISLKRLSKFTGLNMQWLQRGDAGLFQEALPTEYVRAAIRAKQLGISPDDLEAQLPEIKALLGHIQ